MLTIPTITKAAPAPFPWGPVASVAGSIFSGILGKRGAEEQNRWAAYQAQLNRDFQERMSSTSHQREVADLRAAGLNPILSATRGASSPGGNVAPVVNEMEPALNSARATATAVAQLQNLLQQNKLLQSQTYKTNAEANLIRNKGDVTAVPAGLSRSVLSMSQAGSQLYDDLEPVRNKVTEAMEYIFGGQWERDLASGGHSAKEKLREYAETLREHMRKTKERSMKQDWE